ncbi:MAG: T9SS type A sorting domain-containing protein [Saprospiraceae bacterium]|nr:T9SS type A sorting domain-containing protein [Saprospiraceae bacterium]
MKFTLPLLFLLFFTSSEITAQCEIVNGNFESWTDYTDSFENELDFELTYPIVFPTNWFSVLRLTEIALSGFIVQYFDQDTLDIPLFEGLSQYSPGANGTESAARISGDTLLLASDLLQIIQCSGRPEKMTGYFKYEGEGQDTLIVSAVLFKGGDMVDSSSAIGYAYFSVVGSPIDISRGVADYTGFSADFKYNSDEIPDTAAIIIISSKDEQNPNDTSYHVVDEIQFEGGIVSTHDVYREAPFILTPNPASEVLTLNLDSGTPLRLQLYDAIGNQVLDRQVSNGSSVPVAHLPVGTYMSRIRTDQEILWQKLVINH